MTTTMGRMRRLVLTVIVSLLAFSASGVVSLAGAEPCAAGAPAGRDDVDCAPTCVTCGCCVQAVEPVSVAVAATLSLPAVDQLLSPAHPPTANPRDVLHVPKRARA